MRDNKTRIISKVIEWEGGFVNNPNDNGGPTNMGITFETFRQYKPGASAYDLQKISENEAREIYFQRYWRPSWCDRLPTGADLYVFDTAVLQGSSKAAQFLQLALNRWDTTRKQKLVVDGIMGEKTVTKAAEVWDEPPAASFMMLRLDQFEALDDFHHFGVGWMSRLRKVADFYRTLVDSPKVDPMTEKKAEAFDKIVSAFSVLDASLRELG